MATPFYDLCGEEDTDRIVAGFQRDYFALDYIEDAGQVICQRTYGDWIRISRANSLRVEELVEVRPPVDATPTMQIPRLSAGLAAFPPSTSRSCTRSRVGMFLGLRIPWI
jgi:hypothetical protein